MRWRLGKGNISTQSFQVSGFRIKLAVFIHPDKLSYLEIFYFSNSSQSIENFDKLVTESVDLTNRLFAIRRITNKRIQNDSLFSWIELARAKPIENGFARQDAWGQNVQVPFAWIIGNGEDDQAWKAIMLHTEMCFKWTNYGVIIDFFISIRYLKCSVLNKMRLKKHNAVCWTI